MLKTDFTVVKTDFTVTKTVFTIHKTVFTVAKTLFSPFKTSFHAMQNILPINTICPSTSSAFRNEAHPHGGSAKIILYSVNDMFQGCEKAAGLILKVYESSSGSKTSKNTYPSPTLYRYSLSVKAWSVKAKKK